MPKLYLKHGIFLYNYKQTQAPNKSNYLDNITYINNGAWDTANLINYVCTSTLT